jgi:hypothetical protein
MFARLAWLSFIFAIAVTAAASPFDFTRDTFAFENATVLKYKNGKPTLERKSADDPPNDYQRRCFVMSRAALQFHKFAKFDRQNPPLNDTELATRIRQVARHGPWHPALPADQRVNFPGYANLREMSKARPKILQQNIGSGFATYFRLGNFRMFFEHSVKYQEKTHAHLDAILGRDDLFVGYLSTFPRLTINHAVLVYTRQPNRGGDGVEHYLVYDPNHAEAPRELTWSPREHGFAYQKDIDFEGGFVRVYQSYGKWLQ